MRIIVKAAVLFVLVHLSLTAAAQTASALLTGTILDENGAAVSTVNITLTNSETGLQRRVSSNADGHFTVPLLPPGRMT